MSNYTFTAAADNAIAIEKKSGGLWNNLAGWVGTEVVPFITAEGEEVKDLVKVAIATAEQEYATAHPKASKLSEVGAYRSAKSVVIKACSLGVPLTNEGKVRGKSEVEADINAKKAEKTPMEKYRGTASVLASIGDTLLTPDELKEAIALLEEQATKLRTFMATLTGA